MIENLKKTLLLKTNNHNNSNCVYKVLNEINDYLIVQQIDTLDNENNDIIAIPKTFMEENMYTLEEFLEKSTYIGQTGYYKNMTQLEKYIYSDLILLYKDNYNEILYDRLIDNLFIASSVYDINDFIPSKEEQRHKKRIKTKQNN